MPHLPPARRSAMLRARLYWRIPSVGRLFGLSRRCQRSNARDITTRWIWLVPS
ncbi:hypothetical protein BZL30_9329 [Mycobacterium kansasii]|uniref:Uncharacterized protein n=1 Tax=Mycobacterium kansasii TaxID=1768 RepID=A0A1V3WAC5_MYCKA|nr:hypothetical protein BZL30_9329 [Mycobacterium kansasii]